MLATQGKLEMWSWTLSHRGSSGYGSSTPSLFASVSVHPALSPYHTLISSHLDAQWNQMPFSHTNAISDSQQFPSNSLFLSLHSPFTFEPLIQAGLSSMLHLFILTCSWYSIPMLRVLTSMAIMIPRLKYLLSTILLSFSLKPIQAWTTLFLYSTAPRRLLRPLTPLRSPP